MRVSILAVLAVIALVLGAAGAYTFFRPGSLTSTSSACASNYHGGEPIRTQLDKVTFGHITEFSLPSGSRAPNGITTAQDGSVWFGEESMPALAHLFQNGTLLEYVWPGTYPPPGATNYSCGFRTQIWGVAIWNGSIWASDSSGSQLVSLDPADGRFHFFTLAANSFPDYVVAGLDGRLWFTELFGQSIVRLNQNGVAQTYALPTGISATPTQIYFVNSSYALYADAGQAGEQNGGVYGFNPDDPSFTRLGGSTKLTGVTGLATSSGGFWISEHGPPFVAFYNYSSSSWTRYPTSLVSYSYTTLPYFVRSDGTRIWFNEHYGDSIAEIDPASHSMIEYPVSNPPAVNLSSISGAQTITRDGEKIWFTELSGNRVGFADFSSPPPFSLTALSSREITLKPGGSASIPFELRGNASPPSLGFSDSESTNAVPVNLNESVTGYLFANLTGTVRFTVNIQAGLNLAPGVYIYDITASNLFESYTVFLRVQVT